MYKSRDRINPSLVHFPTPHPISSIREGFQWSAMQTPLGAYKKKWASFFPVFLIVCCMSLFVSVFYDACLLSKWLPLLSLHHISSYLDIIHLTAFIALEPALALLLKCFVQFSEKRAMLCLSLNISSELGMNNSYWGTYSTTNRQIYICCFDYSEQKGFMPKGNRWLIYDYAVVYFVAPCCQTVLEQRMKSPYPALDMQEC